MAKLHTADITATVPLLGGLWALLECRRAWPALLLFLAAILVRPDYAVTCVAILLFAAVASSRCSTGRIAPGTSRGVLAGAAAAAAVLYVAIGAWAQHPGWAALFWFTFVEKRVDLSDVRFDLGEYLSAFPDKAEFIGTTSTPFFVALAVVLCVVLPRRSAEERRLYGLTLALTSAYGLRFLAFPALWDRVWLPLDLWVLVALVLTLDGRVRFAQAPRTSARQP